MGRAKFRRPDGRDGTYGQWLTEVAARWNALSPAEQSASRGAAATRLAAQIRAQDTGPTLMHIYDEIGWFGVWPADVAEALGDIKGDVEVHLNSPGGNVFDGLAIYAKLKQHPGEVSVVVDGLAASAASFIASAASPGQLAMTPNGTMMIHDAWGMCMGNAADMTEMAALLEETSDNIASIYAERGGKTPAEYRDLMRAETWAVGQKAVDLRLADSVRKAPEGAPPVTVAPAASLPWQVTIVAAAPGACCLDCGPDCRCMDAQARGGRQVRAAGMHGDHVRVDPDGDGDCDACPEGDTDHDYWSADGRQLKPLPGNSIANADVDSSDWDASKAWHNGANSDDPAAFYKGICAGRREGDPSKQSSWALPYKYTPSSPPNANGVKAALGRLDSTQGLTNKDEAKAKLQRLMKQINPDYEPEDRTEPDLTGWDPEVFKAAFRRPM